MSSFKKKVTKLQKSYHHTTFKSWKKGQGDSLRGYSIEEENFPRLATFYTFLAKTEKFTRALVIRDTREMSTQPFQPLQWEFSYPSKEKRVVNICWVSKHRSGRKNTEERDRQGQERDTEMLHHGA